LSLVASAVCSMKRSVCSSARALPVTRMLVTHEKVMREKKEAVASALLFSPFSSAGASWSRA